MQGGDTAAPSVLSSQSHVSLLVRGGLLLLLLLGRIVIIVGIEVLDRALEGHLLVHERRLL